MTTPYEFRYARLLYMRWMLAAPVLLALVGPATSYTFVGVRTPQTAPLVAAFDAVPVVWPLIFGIPFAVLLGACLIKNYIAHAYVLAAVAFWLWGVSLIYGVFAAHASWSAASLSMGFCICCLVLGFTYAKGR